MPPWRLSRLGCSLLRLRPARASTTWPISGCRAQTARVDVSVVRQPVLADAAQGARRRRPAARARRSGCAGRRSSSARGDSPAAGTMDFRHTDAGLVNLNYQSYASRRRSSRSCAPCGHDCANSVAGTLLPADLGHALADAGRAAGAGHPLELARRRQQRRRQRRAATSGARSVMVPRLPAAASTRRRCESEITQAGAIGDPFGSGVRTVWWVRGVGPGQDRPSATRAARSSEAELRSTTLKPLAASLRRRTCCRSTAATRCVYRWRNSRHMKRWSRQRFDVSAGRQQHRPGRRQAPLRADQRDRQLHLRHAPERRRRTLAGATGAARA